MIKVIAKLSVKPNDINSFLELAKQIIQETVKESGCISYELVQDVENKSNMFMLEVWQSKEDLDLHFVSDHFTTLVPQMVNLCINSPEINICNNPF